MPSRKWWAARVTALTGLATLVATSGAWTKDATIMAITLVSAAALAWLIPNSEDVDPRSERGQAQPLTLLIYLVAFVVVVLILFKLLDRL